MLFIQLMLHMKVKLLLGSLNQNGEGQREPMEGHNEGRKGLLFSPGCVSWALNLRSRHWCGPGFFDGVGLAWNRPARVGHQWTRVWVFIPRSLLILWSQRLGSCWSLTRLALFFGKYSSVSGTSLPPTAVVHPDQMWSEKLARVECSLGPLHEGWTKTSLANGEPQGEWRDIQQPNLSCSFLEVFTPAAWGQHFYVSHGHKGGILQMQVWLSYWKLGYSTGRTR